MKWAPSFWRKVIYIGIMVALVFPLAYLGMPSMQDRDDNPSPGGLIAQMRTEYKLGQANLGEIDPASETMRLASLGMQGVATTFLWEAANEYKKRSDWDNLAATLNQLTKLQPNFSTVWEHQSWNLAYNVSVEFDDYRQRYHWVKKGIEFLIGGTHKNLTDTRLLTYNGWMIGHKIGRSDEHFQFRQLFNDDEVFLKLLREEGAHIENTHGPRGKPDNWLVAREWYLKAEAVHKAGYPIKGESPLLFYHHVPMTKVDFAQAVEEEGYLDERGMRAWEEAGRDWDDFGKVTMPTTWGVDIRLNDADRGGDDGKGLVGRIAKLRKGFDTLTKSTREAILAERRATLTADERKAIDTPADKRSSEQHVLVSGADQKLHISHEDVALRAPEAVRSDARIIAALLTQLENQEDYVRRYRQIVNFDYWRTRAEVEQTTTAINARKFARDADRNYLEDTNFEKAKENYEKAWDYWAEIYEKHPELVEDANADDVFDQVKRYRVVLDHKEEPFPANFKLKRLLDYKKPNWQTTLTTKPSKPGDKKPEDKKPEDKKPEATQPAERKPEDKKAEATPPEKKPEEKKPAVVKPEPPSPPDEVVEEKKPDDKKAEATKSESPVP